MRDRFARQSHFCQSYSLTPLDQTTRRQNNRLRATTRGEGRVASLAFLLFTHELTTHSSIPKSKNARRGSFYRLVSSRYVYHSSPERVADAPLALLLLKLPRRRTRQARPLLGLEPLFRSLHLRHQIRLPSSRARPPPRQARVFKSRTTRASQQDVSTDWFRLCCTQG